MIHVSTGRYCKDATHAVHHLNSKLMSSISADAEIQPRFIIGTEANRFIIWPINHHGTLCNTRFRIFRCQVLETSNRSGRGRFHKIFATPTFVLCMYRIYGQECVGGRLLLTCIYIHR